MMEIRPATDADIPGIVELLKLSLGESLLPKSEEYWRWKHIDNPFGRSPVYLALEDNTIIGVRAFMRWQWQKGNVTVAAVRAVDTATHPKHQGKGIFKKLTMMLVEDCKREGVDFIFNTPNQQSKPGYLKMGWESAGRLPVSFHINRPLSSVAAFITKKKDTTLFPPQITFPENRDFNAFGGSGLHTTMSRQYLEWRYRRVPVVRYGSFVLPGTNDFAVYRYKPMAGGIELRICDIFTSSETGRNALIQQMFKSFHQAHFVTVSGLVTSMPGLLSATLQKGPEVTIRNLNFKDAAMLHHFSGWTPSLGDLELF